MKALGSLEILAYKYKIAWIYSLLTFRWLLGVLFEPEFEENISSKRRLNSSKLHDVTFQKTVHFIVSAVGTASPTLN
jgi:hypothetical protein